MLSLIGLPLIVAAWTLPALFVLLLAGLLGWAVVRPVHQAWGRLWDAVATRIAAATLHAAESLASASFAFAEKHARHGH
jgi:hypothetical protein